MPWLVRLTLLSFLAGAVVSVGVVALSWPRRSAPGGRALIAMMAAVCAWSVPAAFVLLASSLEFNILFSKLSYLGILATPVCYLIYSVQVTRPGLRMDASSLAAMATPAAGFLVLVTTNEWHHLVWTGFHQDAQTGVFVFAHGPGYFALYGCLAAMVVGGALLHIGAAFSQPAPYRAQAMVSMAAALLPLATASAYAMGVGPLPGVDLTPGAFAIAGLVLTLGLTRYRILDLVPVAKAVVFDRLMDGIVVVDDQHRVVDSNAAARALLGPDALRVGQIARPPLSDWLAPLQHQVDGSGSEVTATLADHHVHVIVSPVPVRAGEAGGTLLYLRDVTRQRTVEHALVSTEDALRDRVRALEEAVGHVRTLQGLLPICAYCKRVRTDEDYWQQIESYVTTRSDLRFSHGICPDCFPRVAAEFASGEPPAGAAPVRGAPSAEAVPSPGSGSSMEPATAGRSARRP